MRSRSLALLTHFVEEITAMPLALQSSLLKRITARSGSFALLLHTITKTDNKTKRRQTQNQGKLDTYPYMLLRRRLDRVGVEGQGKGHEGDRRVKCHRSTEQQQQQPTPN